MANRTNKLFTFPSSMETPSSKNPFDESSAIIDDSYTFSSAVNGRETVTNTPLLPIPESTYPRNKATQNSYIPSTKYKIQSPKVRWQQRSQSVYEEEAKDQERRELLQLHSTKLISPLRATRLKSSHHKDESFCSPAAGLLLTPYTNEVRQEKAKRSTILNEQENRFWQFINKQNEISAPTEAKKSSSEPNSPSYSLLESEKQPQSIVVPSNFKDMLAKSKQKQQSETLQIGVYERNLDFFNKTMASPKNPLKQYEKEEDSFVEVNKRSKSRKLHFTDANKKDFDDIRKNLAKTIVTLQCPMGDLPANDETSLMDSYLTAAAEATNTTTPTAAQRALNSNATHQKTFLKSKSQPYFNGGFIPTVELDESSEDLLRAVQNTNRDIKDKFTDINSRCEKLNEEICRLNGTQETVINKLEQYEQIFDSLNTKLMEMTTLQDTMRRFMTDHTRIEKIVDQVEMEVQNGRIETKKRVEEQEVEYTARFHELEKAFTRFMEREKQLGEQYGECTTRMNEMEKRITTLISYLDGPQKTSYFFSSVTSSLWHYRHSPWLLGFLCLFIVLLLNDIYICFTDYSLPY